MPTYDHALVVGKFAPLHHGHQLLLRRAFELADRVTVVVWSNPDFVEMPNALRAAWVSELYPDAQVLIGDGGPPNNAPGPDHWAYVAQLLDGQRIAPDVVLSSESYGAPFAEHLGAVHVAVDRDRAVVPICGTAIRADVHAHRHLLDPRVYRHFVERVVILGAESTGKSTLAEGLAVEFGTEFVAEYGRLHYAERGGELDLDDYVSIATRHREFEDDAALCANRFLFVDTNAITTMFFSHYYNRESLPALRAMADECRDRYQYVIVCDDDIPFEQDGWRDNETWRARMQGMVVYDLAVRDVEYHIVRGSLDERVEQVKQVLAGSTSHTADRRQSTGPKHP